MSLRVVIAPDKFKQVCDAETAARAMSDGVLAAAPDADVTRVAVADGGEGTLAALAEIFPNVVEAKVRGPRLTPVNARYRTNDAGEALIESAQACGLQWLDEHERNPLDTTTLGVGDLIAHALNNDAKTIFVGLGGSATCDAGAGMASALGVKFLDDDGKAFDPMGATLTRVASIDTGDLDERIKDTRIVALCDVAAPMIGNSAVTSRSFVIQKGGTTRALDRLENALAHIARVQGETDPSLPMTGAAGGLAWGIQAFLGATAVGGASEILRLRDMETLVRDADFVLTGEGSLDEQTAEGKLVSALGEVCGRVGTALIALCGSVRVSDLAGVTMAVGISTYGVRLREAFDATEANLTRHARDITRLYTS